MPSAEKTPEPQAFTKTGERSGAGGVRWELRTRDKFCFHKNIHRKVLSKCLNTSGISDEGTERACKIQ